MRLLCADRHPDPDSICTFRRTNGALLQSGFEWTLVTLAYNLKRPFHRGAALSDA